MGKWPGPWKKQKRGPSSSETNRHPGRRKNEDSFCTVVHFTDGVATWVFWTVCIWWFLPYCLVIFGLICLEGKRLYRMGQETNGRHLRSQSAEPKRTEPVWRRRRWTKEKERCFQPHFQEDEIIIMQSSPVQTRKETRNYFLNQFTLQATWREYSEGNKANPSWP